MLSILAIFAILAVVLYWWFIFGLLFLVIMATTGSINNIRSNWKMVVVLFLGGPVGWMIGIAALFI